MGILSSLVHPANGDTADENMSKEAEAETAAGERQAWERQRALGGVPAEPRAERETHQGRLLREEAHES